MKRPNSLLVALRGTLFSALVGAIFTFAPQAQASNDEDDWSLGPVGGTFRVQPGTGFLRVQSMPTGTPGRAAGLLPGDMIHGAFGEPFGTTLTNPTAGGYKGAVQDLATAIDFAEDWDGVLPLQVLRPGVAGFTANVQLSPVGAFGAAFPRGCPKYQAMYEEAVAGIHALIAPQSNPDFRNNNGRFGLILLSHPDWNSTSGPRPYRTSINKLRDRSITVINNAILQPVKPDQPGYVNPGLENWELTTQVMFLAEYVNRTGDTSATVMNALQRGVQCLENRIQTGGTRGDGHMGHGGVTGDYGNWALNIINVYTHAAFAMAKRAGVQPDQAKWDMSWDYLKRSTARSDGHIEDGYVDYGAPAWGQGNGYDASARTAGSVFGFYNFGQTPTADDTDVLNRMKGYMIRNYHRMQHAHAYTAGGVLFNQLALPYLPEREQRYFMENTRYFFQFHRTAGSGLEYFGGRMNNGGDSSAGYLNYDRVKLYNVAIAGAVANRGLPSIPGENADRLFLRFRAPMLSWPNVEARAGVVRGSTADLVVEITDADGTPLDPGEYSAAWTHVSGPGTVTFSNPSAADSSATFSTGGRHRVQLTVTRGSYSIIEPVDLDVISGDPPPGFTAGQAQYQVYTGISGTSVANLTSNAKFPDSPDITTSVTRLEGTHSGDNYGARIRGFIIPPATGAYRFYIASDDASQFRFGTSEAAATVICSVAGWTSQYNWTANPSQTSAIQNLTAGTPYFFEVLHKEATGADHVAVAWTGPGWSTPEVIEGRYLAIQGGGAPEIVAQPPSRSVAAGGSTTFTVQVSGAGPFLFQWRRNGVAHWPASPNSQLILSNVGAGAMGQYDVVVTTPEGTVTSDVATLTVTGTGAPVAGGLWRDFYTGISGSAVADLTNAPAFPHFPSSSGIITSAEAPADVADNYGQRWTGWITPDTTGNHRFFIASDDASELWLSTNDQPQNRVRIAWVNGWTAARAWSSGGQSALIPLVAGNRYYIEVRHKEGGGADHCAVAWQRPGESQPANGSAPIPGQYLSTLQGGVFDDMATTLTLSNPASTSIHIPENVGLWLEADAQPRARRPAIAWQKSSGPGNVLFTNASALSTGVTFDAPGTYVLRLTYNNGVIPSQLEITVNAGSTANTWSPALHHYGDGSGSVSDNGTTVQLTGSALQSIRGGQSSDGFSLYGQIFDGDFDLITRIASATDIGGTNGERVGLAIRAGTGTQGDEIAAFIGTDASPYRGGFWNLLARHDAYWITRNTSPATNASAVVSNTAMLPRWVRLTRVNGVISGHLSANGTTWAQASASTLTLHGPVRAGLVWATHSSSQGSATFDNIQLVGATANIGPMVDAGPPQTVPPGGTATLAGSATDDGEIQPITLEWSRVSGPGTVAFADPASANTTATFSQPGTYVLRLAAHDGEITTYSETTISTASGPPRWINPDGGSWQTAANWNGDSIVGGSDTLADFSTLALTSAPVVSLDGARTVGSLHAGDTADGHGWTLVEGSGGALTLTTSSGAPEIHVVNQSLTLEAVLAGDQGFVKTGPGLLRVETAGTWTGTTTVSEGTLEVLAKSGDVAYVVEPGATLRLGYITGGGYAPTNLRIHGNGVDAPGGLYLRSGASYNTNGRIELLDAPTSIRHYGEGTASIGTFDIHGNGIVVSPEASGSRIDAQIELISRGYGMSVDVAAGAATATGDLVIDGPLNVGSLGFYKRGPGSVRLNAPATSGNTAIHLQGGTLIAGTGDALGTSAALHVTPGTTLDLNGFDQAVNELWIGNTQQPDGIYHSGNSTFIPGSGVLTVGTGDTAYNLWLAAAGANPGDAGTGMFESHDGSGIFNMIQFALGGDPNDPTNNEVRMMFDSRNGVVGDPMVLTLAVREGAEFEGAPAATATLDGISYSIQGSHDLHSWAAAVEEVEPAHDGNGAAAAPPGYELKTFRLVSGQAAERGGFLRVRISSE